MRRLRLGAIGMGAVMLGLATLGTAGAASAKAGPTVTAQPSATLETNAGTVAYAVTGAGFPPGMAMAVTSGACGGAGPIGAAADFSGKFTVNFTQGGCFPGSFLISATELSPPGHTFVTHLKIIPPTGHGPILLLVNPNPIRINNSGTASFAVNVFGLPAGMTASANFGGICGVFGPVGLPAADLNGHINVSFTLPGCVPGNYQLAVTEGTAPFKQFTKLVVLTTP